VQQLKSIVKRTVRPFVRPVIRYIDARSDARSEARFGSTVADVEAIKEYVPTLLNAIASQNASARQARRSEEQMGRRITQVEERVEFVRTEMMFELRHGAQSQGGEYAPEPQVANPEKLRASQTRLNLGSGHLPRDGYVNVDGRPLPGVDVVADVRRLPFGEGEVDEIYSAHLLEHFPVEQLRRSLLPYWFSLLRPGAAFVAVVPDTQTMIEQYAAGEVSFDELRLVTFGEQEYDGDFHFNMFTVESLSSLLEEAGFRQVRSTVVGRRNGACFEMEIAACRPDSAEAAD
jgi:predicted SAM-dependent methyltransferase